MATRRAASRADRHRLRGTWLLSVGYFTDLNDASGGGYLDVVVARSLVKNGRWDVNAALEATRLNSKMVDYYFGVTPAEVTPARPLYRPGGTTNVTLWITGQYNMTERYALMFGANVMRLGRAAADSPIVERGNQPLLYLGLGLNLP
jgi:outer membrane scaffolding protein for murein synthesis (MipA/OmpV family)